MQLSVDHSLRPASSALTPTGGFLAGFTHTLQPYIGCQFACEYCYVKALTVHRFHQPLLAWGKYAHPRTNIDVRLRTELSRAARKDQLARTLIFMSSVTDPYQAIERRYRLTRACLDVMLDLCPGLLVVQTRSPYVVDDFDRLKALGEHCWLNVSLETDLDEVRRLVTPLAPSIEQRLDVIRQANALGLNLQVTVSPCLPFSNVEKFGSLLLGLANRVIVDSYASGDGMKGRRTAKSAIPALYSSQQLGDWHSEEKALALFDWLQQRIGERAGWSQQGFLALTRQEQTNPST